MPLITKTWAVDSEKVLEAETKVITRFIMSRSSAHVLVCLRVNEPNGTILTFRMIRKMFDMIL